MLFKKMVDVLQYAGMANSVDFSSIALTIKNIEKWHIEPILDKALYSSLDSAYQLITLETSLTQAQQQLLPLCRAVIGSYLCYYFAPKAEISLSDAGTRRLETDQAKTAFQYQVTNFRASHLKEAEQHCESLLEFLSENQSSYPEWTESKAFKQYKKLFIKSAGEFNENYTTASPYRNYWAMRFKMIDVEVQLIKPAITATLFVALKNKDLNEPDTFTEAELELLSYLKKAIAYYTVAFALPYVSVRFDENGITITSEQGRSTNDNASKQGDAGDVKISALIRKCSEDGRQWLKTATDFILENISDFSSYTPPTPVDEDNDEHEQDSGNDMLSSAFGLI